MSAKAVVRTDWHAYVLSMHKQNPLRITKAITLTELAPSPYFSIINVHLVDINVFSRFDEIPSLPVPDNKKKPKRRRRTDGRKDRWTEVVFSGMTLLNERAQYT